MSISIAQSRQQLSSLIAAAQLEPQVITKHNTPVAVLVSAEYFKRIELAAKPAQPSFYSQLMQLREVHAPDDDDGLVPGEGFRSAAWTRANPFADAE
jgi:prevent-host-death family protein